MADNFLGAWRVTETVFNVDESYAGYVHQRRELLRLENGNLRVIQNCDVSAELRTHPMGSFQGEWVFDLRIDGKHRHYLGADVIGMGIQYVDGIMTGRGHWPRFGHSFVSFGFLDGSERQITGGVFHDNGTPVAKIIGIALPETSDRSWPDIVTVTSNQEMSKISLEPIVGTATYSVWLKMLSKLEPEGRTHRIAVLVAGMLQYSVEVANVQKLDTPLSNALNDIAEAYDAASVPTLVVEATKQLFRDASINWLRTNAQGKPYSVLENALEEFAHWFDMPWEWSGYFG